MNYLKESILGMATGAAFMIFWAITGKLLFRKTALGVGDIKLAILIGFFTGPKYLLLILFLAFFFAAIVGIFTSVKKGILKDQRLPFAPFIAIACFLIILYGNQIIEKYLEMIS